MSIAEKLRRGMHSLEGNTELRNLISEEEDVAKAYDNIVKQRDEAVRFVVKFGANEATETKDMFAKVQDFNNQHAPIYKDLATSYRAHIAILKEILARQEKLAAAEKKVKELEKNKKATGSQIDEAKKSRDAVLVELDSFKSVSFRDSYRALTKAYMDFYNGGLQLMSKQMAAIGGGMPQQGHPPQQFQPPQQGYPPPQFQGGPPPGYPPQGYPPPQFQGGPPPQQYQGGPPPQYQGGPPPQQGGPQQGNAPPHDPNAHPHDPNAPPHDPNAPPPQLPPKDHSQP